VRIAILFVLAVTSSYAHADLRTQLHVGGGLEGGMITREPRPDGVMEGGLLVEALLPGRNWGFGASAEVIGRLTDIGAREEAKFDFTVRFATKNRKARFGFGVGARAMLFDTDGSSEVVNGYDFMHIDGSFEIAGWNVSPAMHVGIDFYYAWTFGCYIDTVTGQALGDTLPPMKHVRCGDTMTTTYTGGFATSVRWR
jgi:hypothetical protein